MFAEAHYPSEPLRPEELDEYLSKGWFRMGQTIFTCTYLSLNKQVYRVFWLRILLDKFAESKTLQKLAKLNSKFKIKIQEASITPEKEALFNLYKKGISFEASESLEQLLYGDSELNIYNTLEIALYDEDKLIAVGYFDVGKNSAAGINCFYNPAYKKHSLGKYLIYQKMLYCKSQQMDYFYHGYFTPGYKAFDYKLDIAKSSLEYFDLPSQKWVGFHKYDSLSGTIEETMQKLKALQYELDVVNIENRLLGYNYFNANLFREFDGYELFEYILFVSCFTFNPKYVNPIIVYDPSDQKYHLLHCISVGISEDPENNPEESSIHLLKIVEKIYSTDNVIELAGKMTKALQNG